MIITHTVGFIALCKLSITDNIIILYMYKECMYLKLRKGSKVATLYN